MGPFEAGLGGLAALGALTPQGVGSDVWKPSADVYNRLFAQGLGRMQGQMPIIGDASRRSVNNLMPWGMNALGRLQGNQFLGSLRETAANPMQGFNEQANVLMKRLNTQGNRMMNMAEREGVSAGQGFGGRTAVQKGLIGQGVSDATQAGLTDLLNAGYDRSMQAGIAGGGLLAQGLLGGLDSMQGLHQLRMQPFQDVWQPLMGMKAVAGNPIMTSSPEGGII